MERAARVARLTADRVEDQRGYGAALASLIRRAVLLLGSRRFLWKFETDFAVLQFQIRGERASAFRDEPFEEIRLSSGEKFQRLFFWNLPTEDRFA